LPRTVALTHTRRRWAFVCGLLAAGWRECGVPCTPFFYFFIFFVIVITAFFIFCRRKNGSVMMSVFYTPLSIFAFFFDFS
jgi:hypothetical protein